MISLHALFDGLSAGLPAEDPNILGLCHDSRRVAEGDLYVALVGAQHDGREYCAQAAQRGAVAVLGQGQPPAELDLPWVEADTPRQLMGPLAAKIYGRPHEALQMVGITGTNGKSTVVELIAAMLATAQRPAGMLGTLGARLLGGETESTYSVPGRTTPEAPDLFRTLRALHGDGATAAVMEVSSHALALGRVEGAAYDVAVFTNLSRDHLDFHGDLEGYFAAKAGLFGMLKDGGHAVLPADDPWGRRLIEVVMGSSNPSPPNSREERGSRKLARVLTYGEGGEVDVEDATLDLRGIRARFKTPRGSLEISTPLLGSFNLRNILAAVTAAEALELPHAAMYDALAARQPVPGRLDPVDAGQPFPAIVDYAHTPAALGAALDAVGELASRRVAVVFGCGGDRDRGKRAEMGRIAGERAALPILTSDNPRSEDPLAILADVEEGLRASGCTSYLRLPERREAIHRAIQVADEAERQHADQEGRRWSVLVAGKGHETEQVIGKRVLHFSDHEEIRAALANHGWRSEPTTEAQHG